MLCPVLCCPEPAALSCGDGLALGSCYLGMQSINGWEMHPSLEHHSPVALGNELIDAKGSCIVVSVCLEHKFMRGYSKAQSQKWMLD